MGSTDEITRNLELAAREERAGTDAEGLAWYRPLLFWHYGLPCSVRAHVAAIAFSILWIAWALRLLGAAGTARAMAIAAAVCLVVFGSSVVASLHAEARDSRDMALHAGRPDRLLQTFSEPAGAGGDQ
jgi:hypothetical protein